MMHCIIFLTLEPKGSNPILQNKLKTETRPFGLVSVFGGGNRIWTDESGFCRPTPYHLAMPPYYFFDKNRTQETGRILCPVFYGADDEARTRYLHLGKVALYQMSYIRIHGASDRNRTNDTRIFSPLLYQLSYRGKKWRPGTGSNRRPLAWQASVLTNWTTGPFGGNNRARTCDPLLVRQMLSQLSYAPTFFCCCVSAAHIR